MSGHVIESNAYPLARESARDVNAQLLAPRCCLGNSRAGLVEVGTRYLECVARPKLLVCHVGWA